MLGYVSNGQFVPLSGTNALHSLAAPSQAYAQVICWLSFTSAFRSVAAQNGCRSVPIMCAKLPCLRAGRECKNRCMAGSLLRLSEAVCRAITRCSGRMVWRGRFPRNWRTSRLPWRHLGGQKLHKMHKVLLNLKHNTVSPCLHGLNPQISTQCRCLQCHAMLAAVGDMHLHLFSEPCTPLPSHSMVADSWLLVHRHQLANPWVPNLAASLQ